MTLTVEAAGVRVASDLEAAERQLNEALLSKAKLLQSLLMTRLDTGLPQYEGQIAIVRLQEAIKADIDSMNSLIRTHKSLRSNYLSVTGTADEPGRCPASIPFAPAGEASAA